MPFQPFRDEKLLAHQRQVSPGDGQEQEERRIERQAEEQLDHGGGDAQDPQFAQTDQAARHRPIRAITTVLLEILELVGDAKLEEEEERGAESDDHGEQRRQPRPSAQQRREADGRRTERQDQNAVGHDRKALALVDPPAAEERRRGRRGGFVPRSGQRVTHGRFPGLRPSSSPICPAPAAGEPG